MPTARNDGSQQPRVAFCAFLTLLVAAILATSFEIWRSLNGQSKLAVGPSSPTAEIATSNSASASELVRPQPPSIHPHEVRRLPSRSTPSIRTIVEYTPVSSEPPQHPPNEVTVAAYVPPHPPSGIGVGFEPAVRYQASAGSKVSIDGTSTVHDWRVVGNLIGGYLEFEKRLPTPLSSVSSGTMAIRGECVIPVRSLASVEGDGRPYSSRMDDALYEALREPRHHRIAYYPTSLVISNQTATEPDREALSSASNAPSTSTFLTAGELVVAGVTNQIQMPVTITSYERKAGALKISGSVTVKMTDFNIKPPQPAFSGGVIKVGDPVVLSFDWVVSPSQRKS